MKKTFWKDYWNKQSNGQHHCQTETFLKGESEEKLFFLREGENLLDFGCGSADLLAYYAPFFKFSVGADASKLMLEKAKERLSVFNNQSNVRLIHSDNYQIWNDIMKELGKDFKFDCITSNSFNFAIMTKLLTGYLKGIIKKLFGKPFYELGYIYPPSFFVHLAQKYNLNVSCFNSIYYDYRYHIYFTKIKK